MTCFRPPATAGRSPKFVTVNARPVANEERADRADVQTVSVHAHPDAFLQWFAGHSAQSGAGAPIGAPGGPAVIVQEGGELAEPLTDNAAAFPGAFLSAGP